MTTHVTATVVGGMLKPDQDIHLDDQTRVCLTIDPLNKPTISRVAWESLKGRLRARPIRSGGRKFTRDELHERR